jgi:hypothetical protein
MYGVTEDGCFGQKDVVNKFSHIRNEQPWVDSAFNRNEYREYFLGVKEAGA